MSGQDKYLGIFKDEAREHLDAFHAGLLDLENNPGDLEIVKTIMRNAHTIKGSARMVGLLSLGDLAHRVEDVLKAVQGGLIAADTDAVNILLGAADCMEASVLGLPSGGPDEGKMKAAALQVSAFLEARLAAPQAGRPEEKDLASELSSLFGAPAAASPQERAARPDEETGPAPARPDAEAPSAPKAPDRRSKPTASGLSPDTMRVKVPKLDNLSNLTGELVIMKSKIDNNLHRLDTIMKQIKESAARGLDSGGGRAMRSLTEIERFLSEECNDFLEQFRTDFSFLDLYAEEVLSETLSLRLLPVSTIFDRYHRLVRDLKQAMRKDIRLEISGGEILLDRQILEEINPALMHLIQNSADHGIEPPDERAAAGKPPGGLIELNAFHRGGNVVIEIRDDGRGMNPAKLREAAVARGFASAEEVEGLSDRDSLLLVFKDGFTTSDRVTATSGRGVGMSVVWEKVQRLKGSVGIDSRDGEFTRIQLVFPPAFYKMKALLVEAGRQLVCLPSNFLVAVARINPADVSIEGRTPMISIQGRIVPLVDLCGVLGLPKAEEGGEAQAVSDTVKVVMARIEDDYIGFRVDRIHRLEEIIVKSAGQYFAGAPLISGVTILRQGDPSIIVNIYGLFKRIRERGEVAFAAALPSAAGGGKKRVLVVDDSITTRTMEKSILEGAGYEVETAKDGEEALAVAAGAVFDVVVTDIEMPGMNGFELTKRLKATSKCADVPVVIVTSLARDEDKRKGIEVGAAAYIVKGSFQQKTLLDAVRRLAGA